MYYINVHGRNTPVLLPMLRTQPDWLFRAMAACWLPSNTHTQKKKKATDDRKDHKKRRKKVGKEMEKEV